MQVTTEGKREQLGYVFIHGAGLGSEVWQDVMNNIENPCLLLELPGRGEDREVADNIKMARSFTDYFTFIKQQVEGWPVRRFIVVAHSIGGLLGLQLCASLPERAVGFAAVSAAIPKDGKGSFLSCLPFPQKQIMKLIIRKLGTKPPDSQLRSGLCNDLPAEVSNHVVSGFVPESVQLYTDPVDCGIPDIPKLYVMCARDRQFGLPMQKKLAHHLSAEYVETLPTGHLPMLSDPRGLSDVLQRFSSTIK